MSSLSPCFNCHRHIRLSEQRCPFCAESARGRGDSAGRAPLPRGLKRAALFAVSTTALVAAACGGEDTESANDDVMQQAEGSAGAESTGAGAVAPAPGAPPNTPGAQAGTDVVDPAGTPTNGVPGGVEPDSSEDNLTGFDPEAADPTDPTAMDPTGTELPIAPDDTELDPSEAAGASDVAVPGGGAPGAGGPGDAQPGGSDLMPGNDQVQAVYGAPVAPVDVPEELGAGGSSGLEGEGAGGAANDDSSGLGQAGGPPDPTPGGGFVPVDTEDGVGGAGGISVQPVYGAAVSPAKD